VNAGYETVASGNAPLRTTLMTGFFAADQFWLPAEKTLAEAPRLSKMSSASQPGSGFRVERLRGYLIPPFSGAYRLCIASLSPGGAEMWISADERPSRKERVAWVSTEENGAAQEVQGGAGQSAYRAAMERAWHRSPTQMSRSLTLAQGRKYYIELWHQGAGIQSLALGWELPGQGERGVSPVDIHAFAPFLAEDEGSAR
jgi:hypothetical protein